MANVNALRTLAAARSRGPAAINQFRRSIEPADPIEDDVPSEIEPIEPIECDHCGGEVVRQVCRRCGDCENQHGFQIFTPGDEGWGWNN